MLDFGIGILKGVEWALQNASKCLAQLRNSTRP